MCVALGSAYVVLAVQAEGLKVSDVVVLIDREQGGAARMASNNLRLHSAFTLSFIIGVLLRHSLVTEQVAQDVKAFIAGNQTFDANAPKAAPAASAPSKPKRCALVDTQMQGGQYPLSSCCTSRHFTLVCHLPAVLSYLCPSSISGGTSVALVVPSNLRLPSPCRWVRAAGVPWYT